VAGREEQRTVYVDLERLIREKIDVEQIHSPIE